MLSRISTSRGRQRREDRRGLLAVDRQLAELLEDPRRDGRLGEDLVVDQELAEGDAADDRDEVVGPDILEDERRRAGLDRVEQRVLVLVDGEHDDPGRRQLALDPLGRLDAAGRRQREVHEDDVGRRLERAIDRAARVVGLADDLEVRLAAEDVGDPDPEQGMVVDDQDPRRLARIAAIRATSSPIRAAVIDVAHSFSFAPDRAFVGIASRTTVPPSARDRTSNRAPISSARSRMNCSPKFRRRRDATVPTSKPRPSSRISSTHAPRSAACGRPRSRPRRACAHSGGPPGRPAARPSAVDRRARRTTAPRSSSTARSVPDRSCSAVSPMAVSSPGASSGGGRSWLRNRARSRARAAAVRAASRVRGRSPSGRRRSRARVVDLEDRVRERLGRPVMDLLCESGALRLVRVEDATRWVVRSVGACCLHRIRSIGVAHGQTI